MGEITGPFPLEWPIFMMNVERIYGMIPTGSHLQRASMPEHDPRLKRSFPGALFPWLFDALTWECSVAPGHHIYEATKHKQYPSITREALKSHPGWRGGGKGKSKEVPWGDFSADFLALAWWAGLLRMNTEMQICSELTRIFLNLNYD